MRTERAYFIFITTRSQAMRSGIKTNGQCHKKGVVF